MLRSTKSGKGRNRQSKRHGTMPVSRQAEDTAFAIRHPDSDPNAIGRKGESNTERTKGTASARHLKQAVRKTPARGGTDVTLQPRYRAGSEAATGARSPGTGKPSPCAKPSKPKTSGNPRKGAAQVPTHRSGTKRDQLLELLRRKGGASLAEMQKMSGWQAHSVRGFLAGTVKTRLGLRLRSSVPKAGERRYTIAG